MGTHPIFESDFDCLTEWESERELEGVMHSAKSRKTKRSKLSLTKTIQRECQLAFMVQRSASSQLCGIVTGSFRPFPIPSDAALTGRESAPTYSHFVPKSGQIC